MAAIMRSGNPALSDTTFRGLPRVGDETMTIQGTVNKTGIALLVVVAGAAITWNTGSPILMLVGVIGGLILGLVTAFKKTVAPYTTLPYAFLEGLFLGGISRIYEQQYEGIVPMAVGLTLGVLAALLFAYKSRLIRVTENFRLGVMAATGGIAIFYLISFGLSFFGIRIPYIHESGPIGILFSLAVVGIASMNLVLDFDFIERGSTMGAPRFMEWYGAFGLLVTLIWLYLEILRLLSKIMGKGGSRR
jgi:uncharacterized YccA/Bax inhibitor family protein